jgi:[ribosomal protein S5]-alanine N-acetyltransferase
MRFYIETERLILRDILPTDEEAFFEMDSNPDVHIYLGNQPVTSREQIKEVIQNIQQQYEENGIGRWAVIEKESGKFIGWSGLKFIKEHENNHINFYDVGYRFHPKYWGKGYATESAKAALAYGFNELKLNVIYGMANIENKASRRALEKCGLRFVEKFDFPLWNVRCDWLKITKEEWTNNNNQS